MPSAIKELESNPTCPVQNIMSGPRQLYQPKAGSQDSKPVQLDSFDYPLYHPSLISSLLLDISIRTVHLTLLSWVKHSSILGLADVISRPVFLCAKAPTWPNLIEFCGRKTCPGDYAVDSSSKSSSQLRFMTLGIMMYHVLSWLSGITYCKRDRTL